MLFCCMQPETPVVGDKVKDFSEEGGEVGVFVGQDAQIDEALVKYPSRGVVIQGRQVLVKVNV
jgi:hypothetical protein